MWPRFQALSFSIVGVFLSTTTKHTTRDISGKRESRHHLFTECQAWTAQIRRLWRRVGKDCEWKHPRAPAVRKLRREGATGAVLEFLEDTLVGRWQTAGGTRAPRWKRRARVRCRRVRRVIRGRPRLLGLRASRRLGDAGGQTICTDNCTGTFSFVLAGRLRGD